MAAIRRVWSLAAVFLTAVFPCAALAEDYLSTQAYVHSFNNSVTVYSGVFALNRDLSLDSSVYMKYTVDLINPSFGDGDGGGGGDDHDDHDDDEHDGVRRQGVTVASGASAAATSSGGSATDTRHDITGGFTRNLGWDTAVEVYFDYSTEKDYISRTPTVSLKKDLFEKNTTLTLGYSRNMDTIGGQFLAEEGTRNTNNYFAGITQVLSPFTVAQAGYSLSESKGLLSEGIRLVPVAGATQASCTALSATCVNEFFPDERRRRAYLAGVNHYFAGGILDRSALKLTFRYYKDDWEIDSKTSEAEWYKYLGEGLILRLNYRYYEQEKAYFIKAAYDGTEIFKAVSPQLEAFNTHLAGVKAVYNLSKPSADGARLGLMEGKYEYYRESTGVNAHIVMAGLRFAF